MKMKVRIVSPEQDSWLDTYFVKRNRKSTLARLSPTFSGFGTGTDEVVNNLGDCRGRRTL